MKKVAVVLSGCGFKDGTEITEAISTLIALSQEKAEYSCFAPNTSLKEVNHLTGKDKDTRNVLEESARISRGDIQDLRELNPKDFDALVLPGGFGAAKNLCTWAEKGAASIVLPELEKVILDFYKDSKPIGAMCIAPVILAKVLGKKQISVTIGNDTATAAEIAKTGAIHEDCPVDEYVSDRDHKILTTPAYMYNAKPNEVFKGISMMIRELVEMA